MWGGLKASAEYTEVKELTLDPALSGVRFSAMEKVLEIEEQKEREELGSIYASRNFTTYWETTASEGCRNCFTIGEKLFLNFFLHYE